MGLREEAIASTVRWASRFTIRPWGFEQLVTTVESETSTYARAITRWTRRTPVWRQRPHHGGKRTGDVPIFPDDVDPWRVDEQQLARDSWVVETCVACDGAKKIDCPTCDGVSRVRCTECGGDGRVMSSSRKSTRMVNCRRCQGSGQMKCAACRNGRVPCPPCEAKGKVERWIEIETTHLSHVGVWPSGLHVEAHPALGVDSEDADRWPGAELVERLESGDLLADGVGGSTIAVLKWASARVVVEPRLDVRLDRAKYQGVRCYTAPVTRVAYRFSGRDGFLQVFGREAAPTTNFDATPFASYRKWLTVAAVAAASVVLFGSLLYLGRDPFYRATIAQFFLALFVLGSGALLHVASWRRRVGCANAKRGLVGAAGVGLSTLGVIATSLLVGLVHPSLGDATSAIDAGNLALARRHLEALDRTGVGDTEDAWVAYYLSTVDDVGSDEELLEALPGPDVDVGDRPEISTLRREAQLRRFDAAVGTHDFGSASQHLAELREEHGGDGDEVDARLKSQLMSTASALLRDGDALEAERALAVAWNDFEDDVDYEALGERVLLVQASTAPTVDHKVLMLRRAHDLGASAEPRQELGSLYRAEKSRIDAAAAHVDEKRDRLGTLGTLNTAYNHLRVLFPEHRREIEESLRPIADERGRLLAKKRAQEEGESAAAERKRQAALRKEERRRRKEPASRPVMRTCCKYCSKGIPCGDTCISATKTCHKGPGCAC